MILIARLASQKQLSVTALSASVRADAFMETTTAGTYMILGGDGQQYGPITAEQFRDWTRDGRVNGQTQVLPTGAPAWCAASTLPELGVSIPTTGPGPVSPQPAYVAPVASDAGSEQRIRSGASWFYWVAGMSIVNSVLLMANASFGFAVGLGLTTITDVAFATMPVVALLISVGCSALIAGFGYFAIKRHTWAFLAGMIVLLLDTGLCVLIQSWISVALHVWALVSIFMAFRASRAARG